MKRWTPWAWRAPSLAVVLIGAAWTVGVVRGQPATPLALDEIRPERIAAHLRFLADDLLEGRAPATPGGDLAARYVAAQFEALGLRPGGEDRYFQPVPIVESTVDPAMTLEARPATGSGDPHTFGYSTEMVAVSDSVEPEVQFEGQVVFVGYGIVAPEYRWDDYAGVDVTGKIVLVMVNDPAAPPDDPELFQGRALTYYGRWTYKYEEAARQGAAGAILIHTTESATYPWQVVQSSWGGTQYALPPEPGRPSLDLKAWMTDAAARTLVRLGGRDLDRLRADASAQPFTPVALDAIVSGRLTQRVQRQTSPNVIGFVRGTNPGQAVIYTAHYDHLGIHPGQPDEDRIYNGALDNASGVAGMLAMAEAYARAAQPPGRSVYFVATTAEEAGLLGSEYLAAHPPLAIDQVAANINVDGLNVWGRSNDIVLLGAERSSLGTMADRLAAERGRRVGQDPEPERGYFFRSDHFPLAKAGVPAVSISDATDYPDQAPGFAERVHTRYVEQDYHQPSDEYDEAWRYDGAVADLAFLAELGWRVAAAAELPAYRAGDQFRRPRDGATP